MRTAVSVIVALLIVALGVFGTARLTSASPAASLPAHAKGIDIVYLENAAPDTQTYVTAKATAAASFVKGLGANSVALVVPLMTDSLSSNTVFAGLDPANTSYRSPTTTEVGWVISAMESAGLAVDLRPLISEGTFPYPNYRGTITPTNRATWFASYQSAMQPYVALGQQLGVQAVTIQSELQSMNSDPHWTSLISWTHSQFSGQVLWNPTLNAGSFGVLARPNTSLALDYYPLVNLPTTATVGQLLGGWNRWWNGPAMALPAAPSQTLMSEVGSLAQDGAYPQSYAHSSSGAFDQAIQANWFSAACEFSRQHGFNGIFFWFLNFLNPLPSLTTPNTASPASFQPATLAAIKSCFGG
jgi:hypothetical protein